MLTPSTRDRALAYRWLSDPRPGVDGVVVKPSSLTYQPNKRAMTKVKLERTADCVVAGMRLLDRGEADEPLVSSLLLGLYDDIGDLVHVGVASSFSKQRRHALFAQLRPYVTSIKGHPWDRGFRLEGGPTGRLLGAAGRWTPDLTLDWVPLRPDVVAEVAHDHVDTNRFRHPARFRRWRPDRDARSCRVDQLQLERELRERNAVAN